VILKNYIVEQNFNILNEYKAVLLYGENDGFKDDIKSKLKKNNQESEIINFFESEIIKNKNILYENIVNGSLFGGNKIIFIQYVTDKILSEITQALEKNDERTKLYVFCDALDKKSKLRKLFETQKNLAVLACYADNERTLVNYINKALNGFKGLSGELINLIITNSGSNRKIIQNELVKIKDYFVKKIINEKQLLEILNIKNDTSFDDIRDKAMMGEKKLTNKLLSEIEIHEDDAFFYLNNLNFRILKLIEIQESNSEFNDYQKTIDNMKPPIFWKDKPVFLKQLKKWNLDQLYKAAYKVGETEILMKKNSKIKNSIIIKDLIIVFTNEASISY